MRVDKKIYILLLNFIEECHMKIMMNYDYEAVLLLLV